MMKRILLSALLLAALHVPAQAQQYIYPDANATARTNNSKLSDIASVIDFGADKTGVANSATAFTNAAAAVTSGGLVLVPPGTYKLDSSPTIGTRVLIDLGATYTGVGSVTTASRLVGVAPFSAAQVWGNPTASSALPTAATLNQILANAGAITFVSPNGTTNAIIAKASGSTSAEYTGHGQTAANGTLLGGVWSRADASLTQMTSPTMACVATGSGGITGGTAGMCVDSNQSLVVSKRVRLTAGAPTLSGCGTSPAVSGNGFKGVITQGTGATECTATFSIAATTYRTCLVTSRNALAFTYDTTTTTLVITNIGILAGTKLDYDCAGD